MCKSASLNPVALRSGIQACRPARIIRNSIPPGGYAEGRKIVVSFAQALASGVLLEELAARIAAVMKTAAYTASDEGA